MDGLAPMLRIFLEDLVGDFPSSRELFMFVCLQELCEEFALLWWEGLRGHDRGRLVGYW